MRIACQTITFGAEQGRQLPEVFAAVASAGYAGVEVGFRHVAPTPARELSRQLGAAGLEFAVGIPGTAGRRLKSVAICCTSSG